MSVYPAALPTVRPAVRSAFEQGSGGGAASIIAGLFSAGQQGFWLPFTDFASLTQDSAGTLPYTALEQPVGRVLDRSGRGNHATQPTSTARGVVSSRVNLLQKTDNSDISGPPWTPQGTATTASGNVVTFTGQGQLWLQAVTSPVPVGVPYTFKAKLSGTGTIYVLLARLSGGAYEFINTKFTLTGTPTEYSVTLAMANAGQTGWNMGLATSVDGTARVVTMSDPMFTPASQASLPYQRVTTPTDYDAVGFPKFLRVEVDDFYTCNGGGSSTGFYYSDVIRPMGGAGTRRVIWSDRSGNNGYELAINTANKLEFSAGNGTAITAVASTASVVVAEGKQYEVMDDGAVLSVQIDGSAPVTVARPVVTAGSSTITLYRGASTGYFNGQITEPIYRAGPPPSAYERSVIRGYQMQKAGL